MANRPQQPSVGNPEGYRRELWPILERSDSHSFQLEKLLHEMAGTNVPFGIQKQLIYRKQLPALILRGPVIGNRNFCLHVQVVESFLQEPVARGGGGWAGRGGARGSGGGDDDVENRGGGSFADLRWGQAREEANPGSEATAAARAARRASQSRRRATHRHRRRPRHRIPSSRARAASAAAAAVAEHGDLS